MRIHMKSVTRVLGPYLRYVLWVQGCSFKCKGCIAENSWDFNGGDEISVSDLIKDILKYDDIEGITISGGEPIEQAEDLYELLQRLKKLKDIGVILYTGYTYSELLKKQKGQPNIKNLLGYVDLLIDGKYIVSLDDGLSLRGSSNQKIYLFTKRYEKEVKAFYGKQGRKVEFVMTQDMLQMIGIPAKGTEQIKNIMRENKDESN